MLASYHLSVKTISRAHGRSATAAAAYRSGERIRDQATGAVFDYTRKRGVEHSELVLPEGAPEWARNREALWNAAEAAERRKNSTVAREFEVALPAELNPKEREALAGRLARELVARHVRGRCCDSRPAPRRRSAQPSRPHSGHDAPTERGRVHREDA